MTMANSTTESGIMRPPLFLFPPGKGFPAQAYRNIRRDIIGLWSDAILAPSGHMSNNRRCPTLAFESEPGFTHTMFPQVRRSQAGTHKFHHILLTSLLRISGHPPDACRSE